MVDYRVSWKEAFQPNLVHWLSRDESYRDVTFVCQGEKMSFHQSFLSLHSPFLKTLIETQPCSTKNDVIITLEDVKPNILKKLMKVLYTGCCVVEPRENHEILVLMKMLDIKADIMFKLIGQNELDEIMIDIEMEHLKLFNSAPQNISPVVLEKIGFENERRPQALYGMVFGTESFLSTSKGGRPDQDCSHDMNKSEVEGDKSDDHENGHETIKSGNLSAISNEPNSALENAIIALSDTSLRSVPDAQNDQAETDFEILREYTDRFPETNYTLSDYFSLAERRVSMELSRASANFLDTIEVIENVDYSKDLFATYFEELARKNLGINTDEEHSRILSPDLQNNKQPSTLDISANLSPIKSLMASSNSSNLQMMTTNFSIEEIPESPSPIKSLWIGSISDLEKEKESKSSEELLSYCLTQPVSPVDQSSVSMESLKSPIEQMSQMSESLVSMKSFNSDDHSGAVDNSSTKLSSCTLTADISEEIYKSSSTMKSSASSSKAYLQQDIIGKSLVEIPTPSSFDRRAKSPSSLKPLVLSSINNLQLANVDHSRDLFATYLEELARNNCEDNPCILSLGSLDVQDDKTSLIEETNEFSIDKLPETSLSQEPSVMDSSTNLQRAQLSNPLVNVTSYNVPQSTNTVEEMAQSSSTSCLQLWIKDISYVDLTNYSPTQASSIESSATSLKSDHHLVTKYNSSVPSYILTQSANNFKDISQSSSSTKTSKSDDHVMVTVSDISSSTSTIKSSSSSSVESSKSSLESDHQLLANSNFSCEIPLDSHSQSTNTFAEISKTSSNIRSSVTPTKSAHELVVPGNSSVEPPSCILSLSSINVEEKSNSSSSIKSVVTTKESDHGPATIANSAVKMPSDIFTKSTNTVAEISKGPLSSTSSVTKSRRNTRLTTTGNNSSGDIPSCILTKSANTFRVHRKLQSRKTRRRKMQQAQSSQAEKVSSSSDMGEENSEASENVSNKDRLPCDVCSKTFANRNTLEVHLNKFH